MSYRLYGARGSGSLIVESALAELDVPYEIHDLDMRGGEQHSDAYRRINANGKIPTLQLGDAEPLSESLAIVLTLDERHPEGALLPSPGSPERAVALRWMSRLATELYPLIELVDHPERFVDDAPGALRERALETWRARWLHLERELPPAGDGLLGRFCAADLYVAVLSRWDMPEAWRKEHLVRVERITAAVRARPRVDAVWRRHYGPAGG